jgi:hypothetical protein
MTGNFLFPVAAFPAARRRVHDAAMLVSSMTDPQTELHALLPVPCGESLRSMVVVGTRLLSGTGSSQQQQD